MGMAIVEMHKRLGCKVYFEGSLIHMRSKRMIAGLAAVALLCAGIMSGCKKEEIVATPEPAPVATPVPTVVVEVTTPEPTATPKSNEPQVEAGISPLTGLPCDVYRPIAVMIENTQAAYPQNGLSEADIVYEVYEEGGITRFFAIFNANTPEKVGPVRSCRIYYVDIWSEFQSILAHYGGPQFGGTPDVYAKFESANVPLRVDGLGPHNDLYWRDTARKAPHNAYTNAEKIAALYDTNDFTPKPHPFFFTDETTEGVRADSFSINYSKYNVVGYVYDAEKNAYLRKIGDKPMVDAGNDETIYVKNVIIQYAKHTDLGTDGGHINIDFVGEGKAEYNIGGVRIQGTWKRDSEDSRTIFMDEAGQEISLLRGNTFVQVVQDSTEITYGTAE
jgi:hypothetical protein